MDKIIVYTDGSAIGNGSAGAKCGWAYKVLSDSGTWCDSGSESGMTNNQMEMLAVLQSMYSISDKETPVEVYSDSKYVVETFNGHFKISKNEELWAELMRERKKFRDIRFRWVKGHDKNELNNEVDRMANAAAQGRK